MVTCISGLLGFGILGFLCSVEFSENYRGYYYLAIRKLLCGLFLLGVVTHSFVCVGCWCSSAIFFDTNYIRVAPQHSTGVGVNS